MESELNQHIDRLQETLLEHQQEIITLKKCIKDKKKLLQQKCTHNWQTLIGPYQKETTCTKCDKVDWEKTRYY